MLFRFLFAGGHCAAELWGPMCLCYSAMGASLGLCAVEVEGCLGVSLLVILLFCLGHGAGQIAGLVEVSFPSQIQIWPGLVLVRFRVCYCLSVGLMCE